MSELLSNTKHWGKLNIINLLCDFWQHFSIVEHHLDLMKFNLKLWTQNGIKE